MIDQLHIHPGEHEPGARRHDDEPEVTDRGPSVEDRSLRCGDRERGRIGRIANCLRPWAQRHQGLLDRADEEAARV